MNKPSVNEFMTVDNNFLAAAEDADAARELGDSSDVEDTEEEDSDELEDDTDDTDDSLEEDSDEEEDSEDGEDEDDSDEEEEDVKDSSKDEPTEVKTYKATLSDGTQIDVADDTTIKIKVDGRFQRVAIKDLKNSYNGHVKHDELIRRTSETNKTLEAKVSEIERENARVKNLTKSFLEGITKGDIFEAMGVIAEMTNGDVKETIQEALDGMTEALEELGNLTPDQIQEKAHRYKIETDLRKKEAKLAKYEEEDNVVAAKKEKAATAERYGIEESQMNEAYQALCQRNSELQAKGQKPIDFTMEDIAILAVDYQTYEGFLSAAEDHEVNLTNEDVRYLMDLAKAEERKNRTRLKEKDYVRLISTYADRELTKLNRKVGAKTAKTTPKKKKEAKEKEIARISEVWDI